VLDGRAVLEGARVEALVVVNGSASLDATTVVVGDVRTLNSTVDRATGAVVEGEVKGLESDVVTLGWVLAPAFFLFMLGLALATIVAGLALAALAARQVRDMERLISDEPGPVLLAGFGGLVFIPLAAVLAIVTIIGAPVGIALLLVVWPAAAYIGYLVAGIWIGDWLLARFRGSDPAGRPYAAAVVGLIVLMIIGLIPLVGAVASLFGFGAVILHGWRAFREGRGDRPVAIPSPAQPLGV
jgi:MFS family permease